MWVQAVSLNSLKFFDPAFSEDKGAMLPEVFP